MTAFVFGTVICRGWMMAWEPGWVSLYSTGMAACTLRLDRSKTDCRIAPGKKSSRRPRLTVGTARDRFSNFPTSFRESIPSLRPFLLFPFPP